jgi:hypothetical protein
MKHQCRGCRQTLTAQKDLDLDQTSCRKGASREVAGLSTDTRTTRRAQWPNLNGRSHSEVRCRHVSHVIVWNRVEGRI